MATKFNREAFAASHFMRALTETNALSAAEMEGAERAERQNVRHDNWDFWRRATIAYYKAKHDSELYSYARASIGGWHPGDERTAEMVGAERASSLELIAIMSEWAAIPKLTADQKKRFITCARRFGEALALEMRKEYAERRGSWIAALG